MERRKPTDRTRPSQHSGKGARGEGREGQPERQLRNAPPKQAEWRMFSLLKLLAGRTVRG